MEDGKSRYPIKLKVAWAVISIVLGPIVLAVAGGLIYALYKCVIESTLESLVVFGLAVVIWAFFWAWDTISLYENSRKNN